MAQIAMATVSARARRRLGRRRVDRWYFSHLSDMAARGRLSDFGARVSAFRRGSAGVKQQSRANEHTQSESTSRPPASLRPEVGRNVDGATPPQQCPEGLTSFGEANPLTRIYGGFT